MGDIRSGSTTYLDENPQSVKPQAPPYKKKVIILSGPTATGKTELSLVLAKALGGEIISADSMQVYKGMDIGTAKVSEKEQQSIPHHLIDIKDIKDPFNVVEFCQKAKESIDSILSRNKVPIIVGGTGFYIHSLIYGPPEGPPADAEIREKLEADIKKFGPEPLYEKLASIDPTYAKTLTKGDRQKIVRALEIILITGKKVSDFSKTEDSWLSHEYNFRCWFVYLDKETLYPKIEKRCDEMLEAGFLDEVKELKALGLEKNLTASQAIGYKQALEYFETDRSEKTYLHFKEEFKKASRRYAKRQFTWFKKEPLFRWLDLETFGKARSVELILHDFENSL